MHLYHVPAHVRCVILLKTEFRVRTPFKIIPRQSRVRDKVVDTINRLSDLMFVLARVLARRDSGGEVLWQPGAPE